MPGHRILWGNVPAMIKPSSKISTRIQRSFSSAVSSGLLE
jgi:hypothetical protein